MSPNNINKQYGVVLCGGLGRRFLKSGGTFPKQMSTLSGGSPLVSSSLALMKKIGVKDIVVILPPKKYETELHNFTQYLQTYAQEHQVSIETAFQEKPEDSRQSSIFQPALAVLQNDPNFLNNGPIYITHGDYYFPEETKKLLSEQVILQRSQGDESLFTGYQLNLKCNSDPGKRVSLVKLETKLISDLMRAGNLFEGGKPIGNGRILDFEGDIININEKRDLELIPKEIVFDPELKRK